MNLDINKKEIKANDKVYVCYENRLIIGTVLSVENDEATVKYTARAEKGHFKAITEKKKTKELGRVNSDIVEKVIEKPVIKTVEKIVEKRIVKEVIKEVEKPIYKTIDGSKPIIVYKPTPRNLISEIKM